MKNINLKKLTAVLLSVLMIVSVIVPGTVFSAVAAEPNSFPAPITSTSPTYLKEFAKPSASISVGDYASYVLPSTVTGSAVSGAPEIATITEQAAPNDSISIYGTNLKGASVYAYGLSSGVGVIKKLEQTLNKDGFINAIIDKSFDYGMYIIWVQSSDGKVSAPVRVNAPKLTWISATKASTSAEIRVYGKFLTTGNADGDNATSYVYLTNGTTSYKANIIEATPYRLTIKLPSGLTNNVTYSLWVHNGHGGDYGWSNSLSITYNSSAEDFWKTTSTYQKTATPSNFRSVISGARAGSTITLSNGTYEINQQVKINKSLRIVGESKDGVKIVAKFTQSGGSDSLKYGDLNVNGSAQAAFWVTATPCEFSNLTFIDYVSGSSLYSGISDPSNYNIDYAHGMFIKAENTSDTGVSAQLKIDNCDFKIQRTHSDTNCAYITNTTTQNTLHTKYEAKYPYYSRTAYASAPLWIDTDRAQITNCNFETPKEIITRGMQNGYIANNTFVGTWVISGNSGPAAIHDNQTQNIDISNNRIYGKDEETDPDGYVQTGDQTFARTIVFQKTLGPSKNQYVANNTISRVGELNYNSGEHILFEEEGVTYVGKVTLSNNNKTLQLKDMPTSKWTSDNQFTGYITGDSGTLSLATYDRYMVGQLVIISKGNGAGQWRTVASAAADRTITIDRDWDVQPDANSTFVVVPGFSNSIVYKNTIEGPKMYYKNFNSTLGVNAYATMVGTVIDRNNFSQMQAGLAINPHYNMKSYTYNGETVKADFGFVMFADLLVMNNTISNTRYGIWDFPSITMNSSDYSTEEADVDLQLCSIIRGNKISDSNRLTGGGDTNNTVDSNLKKRGGASIVVGRDYWAYNQELSTRYWMNNIVVENNTLSDVENNSGNGFIDVSFSQNDTILRNNTTDGELRATYAEVEVERNTTQHNGGKPVAPIYYISVADDSGSSSANERIANNHFLDGLENWSKLTGTNTVNVTNSVATLEKGNGKGIKSDEFKILQDDLSSTNTENKVAFVVKYTSSSSAFNLELFVNGTSKGNATSTVYSSGKLKLFYYDNVYWNANDTYQISLKASTSTVAISLDYVDMARCETKDAILDIINGKVYNSTGDITDQTANDTINNNFTNVEFEAGIDQWEKASHFGSATASNGIVTLASSKLQSDYFKVDLKSGESIAVIYNLASVTNATVTLMRKDVSANDTATNSTLQSTTVASKTGYGITSTSTYTAESGVDSYLSIVIEGTVDVDYISVVTQSGSGINLVYTDIISGKRFLSDLRDPDGTEAEGFEKLNKAYGSNETYAINDTLMNGDFSEGLKYWSAAINSRTIAGVMVGNAADSAKKVENGVVTITPSSGTGRGISSAHFKVPNANKHSQFAVVFDYMHTPGSTTGLVAGDGYTSGFQDLFKAEVRNGSAHTSVKETLLGDTNGAWATATLVVDIADPDECYIISFEGFNIKTEFKLKNVRLMFVDEGGDGDLIGLDGSLVGAEFGDVNKDGEVNLLDYARMVKFMAGVEGTTMYKAAGNLNKDADITVDANDLTYLKEYLVSGNKNF